MKNTPYTQEELNGAILRLMDNNHAYIKAAGIPRACSGAAERCFMDKKPEDNDTALVRQALTDLNTLGHFNYK
jgi:hypothetical protein